MTESNSPRFGLRLYSADADTFSRAEFMQSMNAIETLGAIDRQGTLGSRPAAGVVGTYYTDTATNVTYRDNGTSWVVVGSALLSAIINASGTGSTALIANNLSGTSVDIFQAKVNNVTKAGITKDGQVYADNFTGKKYVATGGANTDTLYAGQAASGQTADVMSLVDNGSGTLFKVSNVGALSSTYLKSANPTNGGSVVGAASADTIANLTNFSGVPAFEVYGSRGGTGTTFTDGLYLKHQAADATAVLRRWGILMRVGDEVSGDASKSAALYLESSAASFGNPKLVLGLGNTAQMQFPASGSATIERDAQVNGRLVANPGSGSSFGLGSIGESGVQGSTTVYDRVPSGGSFYWYGGGVHSTSAGSAGSGGAVLASLNTTGGVGQFQAARGIFSSLLIAGLAASTNTQIAGNVQQAYNNGTPVAMNINPGGGDVEIGGGTDDVDVFGTFSINDHALYIQSSSTAPSSPNTGDVWLQI